MISGCNTSSGEPLFSSQMNVMSIAVRPNAIGCRLTLVSAALPSLLTPALSLIIERADASIDAMSTSGEVGMIRAVMITFAIVCTFFSLLS